VLFCSGVPAKSMRQGAWMLSRACRGTGGPQGASLSKSVWHTQVLWYSSLEPCTRKAGHVSLSWTVQLSRANGEHGIDEKSTLAAAHHATVKYHDGQTGGVGHVVTKPHPKPCQGQQGLADLRTQLVDLRAHLVGEGTPLVGMDTQLVDVGTQLMGLDTPLADLRYAPGRRAWQRT